MARWKQVKSIGGSSLPGTYSERETPEGETITTYVQMEECETCGACEPVTNFRNNCKMEDEPPQEIVKVDCIYGNPNDCVKNQSDELD
jgi:hypothetical protein